MSLLCCCVQGCALLGGATTSAAWWPQSGWQVGGAPIVRGRAEECRKVGQGHAGAWGGLHHLQARVVHNLHTLTTPHLYCHVASPGGATDTAWQRFLPTGPLAVLPVRDGLANIVWSTTPDMAAQLERMGPQEFAQAVNKVCMSMSMSVYEYERPWLEGPALEHETVWAMCCRRQKHGMQRGNMGEEL